MRYYELLTRRLYHRITPGLNQHFAAECAKDGARPVSEAELELVHSLHAAIYYVILRR